MNGSIIGEYKITYPLLLINESNIKGELWKKINKVASEHDKGWLSLAWPFVSFEGSTIDSLDKETYKEIRFDELFFLY